MRQKHIALLALFAVFTIASGAKAGAQDVAARDLQVTVGRAEIDESGFVKIAGEIRNASQEWACSPSLAIELLDASGKSLAVDSIVTVMKAERGQAALNGVTAERTFLPPGEVAVFEYTRDVKKISGTFASQRISAHAHKCAVQPKVAIENFVAKKAEDGWYSVSGRIKNVGGIGCRSAKAVIGCYRADGTLYGADGEQPDETFQKTLAPGQSVDFRIKAIENPGGSTITEVKAWADCDLPE